MSTSAYEASRICEARQGGFSLMQRRYRFRPYQEPRREAGAVNPVDQHESRRMLSQEGLFRHHQEHASQDQSAVFGAGIAHK